MVKSGDDDVAGAAASASRRTMEITSAGKGTVVLFAVSCAAQNCVWHLQGDKTCTPMMIFCCEYCLRGRTSKSGLLESAASRQRDQDALFWCSSWGWECSSLHCSLSAHSLIGVSKDLSFMWSSSMYKRQQDIYCPTTNVDLVQSDFFSL